MNFTFPAMPPPFSSRSLKGGCAKLAALALTGFAALIILCVIKPPLEWLGAHEVRFDDDAKEHAPKGASRIFYFYDNLGIDWSSWTAFTAPPAEIEKFLWEVHKLRLSDFEEWSRDQNDVVHIVGPANVVSPPSRAHWRNRGYWDIEESATGLHYRKMKGYLIDVFYDPARGRVFIEEGSM